MSQTALAVIKLGGNLLEGDARRADIARQIAALASSGLRLLIVHGGGSAISARLRQAGIKPRFVRGMRVTDEKAMRIVEEVLGGINRSLVAAIDEAGGSAVGIRGGEGLLLTVPMTADGEDLGRVGQVQRLNSKLVLAPLGEGRTVVVAPTGADSSSGLSYNVNADVAACALASGVAAEHLLLLSDVAGVLDTAKQRLPHLSRIRARQLIADGVIKDGMVPKVEQALQAVTDGVGTVHILDGQQPDALYNQLSGAAAAGTRITA